MLTQIDMMKLNDNLCCLVRSILFQFHCTQTLWFLEHSSLFALLHHCLEWLNNVSEALSLVVPITTAVHNRDGPRYTLFSELIGLRLSILLWQELRGPVKSRLSSLLVSVKPVLALSWFADLTLWPFYNVVARPAVWNVYIVWSLSMLFKNCVAMRTCLTPKK